jgi:hypothetical protein
MRSEISSVRYGLGVDVTGDGYREEPPAPIGIPSVLRCGLMIFALKLALATRGLGWTMQWIRRRVAAVAPRPAPLGLVRDVEHAVALAAALYAGRALCLEQSLVLYYVLRRQGVAAKYCQGVQPYPFLAHAWVEYGGEPVNDFAEHVKQFGQLPEQLP